MKGKMKKLFALALAAIMVLAMGMTAFAAEPVDSGKGGDASITINNSAKGETYTFYKVFDAKVGDGTENAPITYYTTNASLLADMEKADSALKVEGDSVSVTTNKDTKDVIAQIENWIEAGYVSELCHVTGIGGALTVTNLPYGYYYITSGVGTVIMLDSTDPSAAFNDKNSSEPSWPTDPEDPENPKGKVVIVNGEESKSTTVSIGEEFTYQIKINTVNFVQSEGGNDYKQIKTYTVKDTPDSSITIKEIQSVKVVKGESEKTPAYTLKDENIANGFEMTVEWAENKDNAYESIYDNGAVLVITYTAVLNENAKTDNKNKAEFTWTYTDNGEPDTPPTPDEVEVNTYSFDLVKTNPENMVLSGAEFNLYAVNPDEEGNEGAQPIELVVEDGSYRIPTSNDVTKTTIIEAGNISIKGLKGNTTYYLKETKAPNGYNKKEEAIPVQINEANLTAIVEGTNYLSGGIEVENATGTLLPSTGGIGTTIFYVVGGILVVGAGILLITKKRMSKNN